MSRQPKEKWCPYCQKEVEHWESRRKVDSGHNVIKPQKIRSGIRHWFLCPHCKKKHPRWQYEWIQVVFFGMGIGLAWSTNGFQKGHWVMSIVIAVATAMVLTLGFRMGYPWFKFRNAREFNDDQ